MHASAKYSIVVLSLAALLGLGACSGNATTQGQSSSSAQSEASSQIEEQSKSTNAATTNKQSIGLEGVGNARQLGGYVGVNGKAVKDGVILRTAELGEATEADVARLKDTYHLATTIDFRMESEIEASPEREIEGVKALSIRIIDEDALAKAAKALAPEDQEKMLSDNQAEKYSAIKKLGIVGDQMYINFLSHDTGKKGYAQMFQELLALPEGQSLLFHCTQGKDRTGCAAMLILSALGVDEQTIMDDYMLTNEFNAKRIEEQRKELLDSGVKENELDDIMIAKDQVYPQTMTNALDWLKKEYGSVTGYITKELGITEEQLAQLQNKFLV